MSPRLHSTLPSEQVSLLYPNLSMFIAASVWRGSDFCTSGLFARSLVARGRECELQGYIRMASQVGGDWQSPDNITFVRTLSFSGHSAAT